jgi:hypothetical protein
MLLIVGGLIIVVGTIMIAWDLFVLIGVTIFTIIAAIVVVVSWIGLQLIKLKEWSEQRWESTQTEVYGDQRTEILVMTVEEAAKFAAYVAQCGGNVTVKVVDDDNVIPMYDVTPRRKRLK